MSRAVIAGVLLVAAGCYRAADLDSCAIRCDPLQSADCPGALTCNSQGLCSLEAKACDMPDPDDAMPPPPDGEVCYGTTAIRPCFPVAPTGTSTLTGPIDTDACPGMPQPFEVATVPPSVITTCVMAADTIVVPTNAVVLVSGSLPLVLVGRSSITVGSNAQLDAGSTASEPSLCPQQSATLGAQAGAGGSFGTKGGAGGGQIGAPNPLARVFHGGCSGGRGAATQTAAGKGGGAIYLISDAIVGRIDVNGSVLACGAGGGGAAPSAHGGGGGGSGGFIGLDASIVNVGNGGNVLALGGGGGAGAGAASGSAGSSCGLATHIAAGGKNTADPAAGDGGEGAIFGDGQAGEISSDTGTAGAGGGGGGAGVIEVRGALQNGGFVIPKEI